MNVNSSVKSFLLLTIVAFLLNACVSTTQETAALEVTAYASGPFFEGPNSLMAEYTVNTEELLQSSDYQISDFEQVNIQDVVISLLPEDSLDMAAFASASLSIVSNNEPLTGIATLNPIETDANELTLSSSDEADLAPFFKEGKFTLVLDWDFKEDDYRDEMSSNIKMNLNVELLAK